MTAATGLDHGLRLAALSYACCSGSARPARFPRPRAGLRALAPGRRSAAARSACAIMTGALGGALTQPLVVAAARRHDVAHAFAIFGRVGLVWAVAWWLWFRDDPAAHRAVNAAELRVIARAGPSAAPHERGAVARADRGESIAARALRDVRSARSTAGTLPHLATDLPAARRGFDLRTAGCLAACRCSRSRRACSPAGLSDTGSRSAGARAAADGARPVAAFRSAALAVASRADRPARSRRRAAARRRRRAGGLRRRAGMGDDTEIGGSTPG